MDRREFIKKSAMLGLGAGVLLLPKGLRSSALAAASYPDLVAVKGGTPQSMFDKGMKSIGGMGRFVKKGQTVVVKPNISWNVDEADAANTSPALVAAVVKHCFDAGAKKVIVMDHSIEFWRNSMDSSGLGNAIKSSGATYAPAESDGYYQMTAVGGVSLKKSMIHESILECDVLISVPVLKHHGGAGVSVSQKNLMGCVWDRRDYHANDLHQCIADFLRARKPDLNVVDAYRVITKNGPRGGSPSDVAAIGAQIISPDIVAADSAAVMLMGRKPEDIGHIRLAAQAGFGQMNLSKLKIDRITA
ncbi:hypothetical protein FACS1894167_15050 [Synergistales bacterium]|nr:hypothetical protein FACS1894167_15050 [Synergistales bacterium]